MVAGSDAHREEEVGRYFTEIPGEVRTTAELVEAIRRGACAPAGFPLASGTGARR